MLQKELCSICKFYAVSPIHAGSGTSTSAVDLPIQRERHTEWPHIQASGVKGAFRAHYRAFNKKDKNLINLIFGSDDQDGWPRERSSLPGAISLSDARLLAFPVRSNIAPFVWVTSPSVLSRLNTDMAYLGNTDTVEIDRLKEDKAVSIGKVHRTGSVVIEDAVVNVEATRSEDLISNFFPELENFIVVSDEMYNYAVTSCTEIQTNIKIDEKTGTAKDGALRYQEYLPADSVLYSIVHYSGQNSVELGDEMNLQDVKNELKTLHAVTIKKHVEDVINGFIQIGGDETLGKGICRLSWMNGGES